jgi:hypothetical protein
MGTSYILRTSVTDQRYNRKRLRSLLRSSRKSNNLQVFVVMQRHVDATVERGLVNVSYCNSNRQLLQFVQT